MNKLKWAVLALSLLAGQVSAAEQTGDLTVDVTGLDSNEGEIVANLFSEGTDVMKIERAYRQVKSPIREQRATLVFHHVPYGNYAVSVFHDQNGNGTPDHNMLHLPAEPLGLSNHFKLGLFSGLPSFDKLKFQFEPDKQILEIDMR